MVLFNIYGNILDFDCDIIVHQVNCVTKIGKGLSKSIFDKYPYANYYKIRKHIPDEPGKTVILKPKKGEKGPMVGNLTGQFYPSRPGGYYKKFYHFKTKDIKIPDDSKEDREQWFSIGLEDLEKQLDKIKKNKENIEIAFPYKIGSGMAGGNWNNYYKILEEWGNKREDFIVYILELP